MKEIHSHIEFILTKCQNLYSVTPTIGRKKIQVGRIFIAKHIICFRIIMSSFYFTPGKSWSWWIMSKILWKTYQILFEKHCIRHMSAWYMMFFPHDILQFSIRFLLIAFHLHEWIQVSINFVLQRNNTATDTTSLPTDRSTYHLLWYIKWWP